MTHLKKFSESGGTSNKVASYVLNKPNIDDKYNILSGINNIIVEHENLFECNIKELMNQNNKKNNVN